MLGAVSPSSLERSTYRGKIYVKAFGEGCLGNLVLNTSLNKVVIGLEVSPGLFELPETSIMI